MKKPLKLMNICVALLLTAALAAVLCLGGRYSLPTRFYFPEGSRILEVELSQEPQDIVELTEYTLDDDGQLLLELKALKAGSTDAQFRCSVETPGGGSTLNVMTTHFRVNSLGCMMEYGYRMNFNGYELVILCLTLIQLLILGFMLWSFLRQYREGSFSYSMVACGGIAIFTGTFLAFSVYKMLNHVVYSFGEYVYLLDSIGRILLLGLAPLMLLMAGFLALSNVWLIRHEGFRPVNALGIVFALLWLAATALTLGYNYLPLSGGLGQLGRACLTYVLCYFECMFLSTALCAYLAARFQPPMDKDYIIILGCCIRKDGSLTPLLRGRVESALDFASRQLQSTGKQAVFVPSGGRGPDEIISEGEAMERYLLERGIPAERILREDRSVNTLENMSCSKAVMESAGGLEGKRIAFATTNYHVFRGYILARKCGFEAQGISAKTKTYFYPNAYLREFVGLLVDQKYRHIAYILMILLFFLPFTVF